MKSLAIIPARGGSKRIPRKNIREFLGKPMLAYAIESALKSHLFDEVMISTDDEEIAQIAQRYGASVPFMRSENASNDFASTADVLREVLSMYKVRGEEFDTICCIYPCVPFLREATLIESYQVFKGHQALMPVCAYPVPIEWAMKIDDSVLIAVDKDAQSKRSQDLEHRYYDVGMFYWSSVESFLQTGTLLPPQTRAYVMPERECQDIDTDEDWQMAELKFKILNSHE